MILVSTGIVGTIAYQVKRIKELKAETVRLSNNAEAYQNIIAGQVENNVVLELTNKELQSSKDSLVIHVNKVIAENKKIKAKNVKEVAVVSSKIEETIEMSLPDSIPYNPICDFSIDSIINEQTYLRVERIDKKVYTKLKIENIQTLIVNENRDFKRKGFFNRLIHFDWSREEKDEYTIHNSNKAIEVLDTRVIKTKK